MDWCYTNDRPIYTQLIEHIQRAIVTGEYPPGSKLPSVRELAAEAGVNPNTMQRALAELEAQGMLFTQRTSGRFVTQDVQSIAQLRDVLAGGIATEFVQNMQSLGCTPTEITQYVTKAEEELA